MRCLLLRRRRRGGRAGRAEGAGVALSEVLSQRLKKVAGAAAWARASNAPHFAKAAHFVASVPKVWHVSHKSWAPPSSILTRMRSSGPAAPHSTICTRP